MKYFYNIHIKIHIENKFPMLNSKLTNRYLIQSVDLKILFREYFPSNYFDYLLIFFRYKLSYSQILRYYTIEYRFN